MKNDANNLLFVLDIAGTLVFAVEGAAAAMRANLDLLGLMVLAFATALGGGIIRDVLIGAVPPASLRDWRYSAVAFTGAAVVFFLHPFVQGVPGTLILVLDAAGLALFAIAGTQKALVFGMHPFVSTLLARLPELAEAQCATYCWRRSRACCGRMFTRRRRWRDQR
jgi:uncharacterized membrane protein YeiH